MTKESETVSLTIKISRNQYTRLLLLKQSLSEKMNKEYSVDKILQKIIDDFLQ